MIIQYANNTKTAVPSEQPTIIFVMGPTAAGKTDLAIECVEQLGCELISVDSALVYRDMDIGTARPDAQTLQRAPHKLIDIIDPAQAYSVGRFREDALREIQSSLDRGKILVGGTMLYYKALQDMAGNICISAWLRLIRYPLSEFTLTTRSVFSGHWKCMRSPVKP